MKSFSEGAELAAQAARDSKAKNVIIIDLRNLSFVTDYFVIGTGDSDVQVQSIARHVKEELQKRDMELLRMEGYNKAHWVLLDFGDIVVHVFHKDFRDFYSLERLWGDAPKMEYDFAAE